MHKGFLFLLIVIIAGGGIYRRKFHDTNSTETKHSSEIDTLLGNTLSGSTNTGEVSIDVSSNATNEAIYEGGGTYNTFSEDAVKAAFQGGKRVIIIFERNGDPTSETLHDDVVSREARIPKNTVIFFADFDKETTFVHNLDIQRPNTISYINAKGQEMRRKGNGIVTLSQIVNGIDNLR